VTAEDIEKAEAAADGLYDRRRNLVAIVILANLDEQTMRVIGRAPSREIIKIVLATATIESSITGRVTATIETDERPSKGGT
jgi:hypothetical protein